IDTSLSGLAARVGNERAKLSSLATDLSAIDVDVKQATEAARKGAGAAFAPLADGLSRTKSLIQHIKDSSLSLANKSELLVNLQTKQEQFEIAAGLAAGLQITLKSQQEEVVPGQTFAVTTTIHNGGQQGITVHDVVLDLPAGWKSVAPRRLPNGIA